ncbi:MAG: quinone oxidoreductase, partial [Gammaproteobacteria bacterium]|nr:quinone oxidoreductase [Gammaproteobacteria bacterium]
MSKAIVIHKPGGPEVFRVEDMSVPEPGPGEVLLRQTAVGLNYIDVYHRSGQYPVQMPAVIGSEAAGIVEQAGEGVQTLKPGDRVAYAPSLGAYAQYRTIAADRVVRLPDGIDERQAAAMMLQGTTVEYLIRRTYPVKAGDTVLFHAAAGGVGLIACQWLNHLGATIIGTVGSEEKAALARAHGCQHTINYRDEDIAAGVREITGGKGVPVVYDAVGKDTYEASMNSLQPLGMFVSFGSASGPCPDVSPGMLAQKGSLYFTRPTLMTYTAS